MNDKMPHTPFSTPLSGSAKETEIRIRNIISGPKKRPPLPFLILMFSVCIFCGNLVSCHTSEPEEPGDVSAPDASAVEPADESARWTLYWEEAVPKLLAQRDDYFPEYGLNRSEIILNATGEDLNLLVLMWTPGAHAGGFYNLLVGTFDQECELVDYYDIGGDAGLWKAWDEVDGMHLVCTNTTTYQGWESGGAPMHFRFDGKTLEVVDQLPVSYMSAPAMPQKLSEWEELDCKYLPIPGAVEVYRRTPGWDNLSPEWQFVPQWEYQGTVLLTLKQVDPIPAVVRDAARDYIAHADWEGVSTAGTPILRLEEMAEWNDFSQLSLCDEWKNIENLTLSAWDLDFGDPSDPNYYMNGYTHLLFLRDGEELTFLTTFYDGRSPDGALKTAPEQGLLAGLSPYNWYAVEALYDAGYLTARPKLANIFTKVPAPDQAEELARTWLDGNDPGATITAMEPRFFCVEEPYWMGVYAVETSCFQDGAWKALPDRLLFFEVSSFRSFQRLACALPAEEVEDIEKQTRAAAHGLVDYDVALWDLSTPSFPTAYGPGNYDGFFTGQGTVENSGTWTEYGDRYEARYRSGGWNNRFCISLDTTRRLPTTRGIKMGDSRDKVRSAYPEIKEGPYPGLEGDVLWYQGRGADLIFFFEDGAVSRLVLKEAD